MSDFRPLWGGVGRLMANAILNFHFDFPHTSLIEKLSRLSGNFPDHPNTFKTIRRLSRLSGNLLAFPETFQIIRKLSGPSGNFPDGLETSQCNFKGYAQKLSGRAKTFRMAMPPCHPGFWASAPLLYGKNPENIRTIRRLSGPSGNFPDDMETS